MKIVLLITVLSCHMSLFGGLEHSSQEVQHRWTFPTDSETEGQEGSPCGPTSPQGATCRTKCNSTAVGGLDCAFPLVCCPNTPRLPRLTDATPGTLRSEPGCGVRPLRLFFPQSLLLARRERTNSQLAVVGGREALPFSWPWTAALYLKTPPTLPHINGRFHCGAVLIGRRHLLTAAHCFATRLNQIVPDDFYVLLGSHERSVGLRASLDRIWVHPEYSPRLSYHDIAVLRLSQEAPRRATIAPVCLPSPYTSESQDLLDGRSATLTGWGDIEFGGPSSKSLQEVQIPIVSNEECNKAYKQITFSRAFPKGITENMICAGASQGGKDACQGDSGSPLATAEGGTWVLRGLVSFGYGCGQAGFPGVYTRVDYYLPWLAKTIATDEVTLR